MVAGVRSLLQCLSTVSDKIEENTSKYALPHRSNSKTGHTNGGHAYVAQKFKQKSRRTNGKHEIVPPKRGKTLLLGSKLAVISSFFSSRFPLASPEGHSRSNPGII